MGTESWDEDAEATEAEQQRAVWVALKEPGPGATGSIRGRSGVGLCWGLALWGNGGDNQRKDTREHKGDSLEQTDSQDRSIQRGPLVLPGPTAQGGLLLAQGQAWSKD